MKLFSLRSGLGRFTALISLLVVSSLLISACSSPSPSPSPTITQKPATTVTAAPTTAAPITTAAPSPKPTPSPSPSAAAPQTKLTYQLNIPANNTSYLAIQGFAADIEKRSNGRIKIEEFPGEALMPLAQAWAGTSAGTLDMIIAATTWYAGSMNYIGEFTVLPGNFKEYGPGIADTFYNTEIRNILDQSLRKSSGITVLGLEVTMGKPILLRKGVAIQKLEDFKGKKIRVAGGLEVQTMELLGASPVQLNTGEIYTAVQRGTVDGLLLQMYAFESYKLFEVCGGTTYPPMLTATPIMMVMNAKKFDSLPADLQKAILDAGKAATYGSIEYMANYEKTILDKVKQQGLTIYDIPKAEQDRIRQTIMPTWDWYIEKAGADGKKIADLLKTRW